MSTNTTTFNYNYNNYVSNTTTISPTLYPTNFNDITLNTYIYHNYSNYYFENTINSYINIGYIINSIPFTANKNIPRNSIDIITYENINDDDILIDFKRDNKTEYEYGAYYKESNLSDILKSNKNQFTLQTLDISSIVKYHAILV